MATEIKVGDIVQYGLDSFNRGPQTWRVSGWMRIAPPRVPTDSQMDWLDEILYDACQKIKGHRMQDCLPEEATHLSLSGIAGTIAPVEECVVVGSVEGVWSDELLSQERERAMKYGREHRMLF